jgi:hypothetical protein
MWNLPKSVCPSVTIIWFFPAAQAEDGIKVRIKNSYRQKQHAE